MDNNKEHKDMISSKAVLTQEEAVNVLAQACIFAQSKGVFSLEDAALVQKAISAFPKKESEQAESIGSDGAVAGR